MSGRRVADAVFGILFVALGIAVAILGTGWAYVVALALAVLGVESIVSALRERRSWLSRIGPLP